MTNKSPRYWEFIIVTTLKESAIIDAQSEEEARAKFEEIWYEYERDVIKILDETVTNVYEVDINGDAL